MKSKKFLSYIAAGITVGLCTVGCDKAKGDEMDAETKTFYEQLNPDAKKKFLELDTEHKRMVLEQAEQYCKGEHECGGHREEYVEKQYQHQMQSRQQMNSKSKKTT